MGIEAGDIVTYEDGDLIAVVLDKIDDELCLFNENGYVEYVSVGEVSSTGECTDLVEALMLKLQATEK